MSTILITGASGAIGSALALEYAAPGVRLLLQGRDTGKLAALAAQCIAQGATAEIHAFDLCDIARTREWVAGLDTLDILFANAGMNINIGEEDEGEDWAEVAALLDLNIKATFALVHAALPAMRARRSGQIVLMSSLAAYFGLPVTPAYSASKAAVKAYGESLRGWLAAEGIRVNVVMPGYVDSAMCRAMPGPKPFLWQPERAARVIRRGLDRDRPRISFPFPLNFGCWLMSVGRPSTAHFFLRLFNGRG